jgi:hypothetical protein
MGHVSLRVKLTGTEKERQDEIFVKEEGTFRS